MQPGKSVENEVQPSGLLPGGLVIPGTRMLTIRATRYFVVGLRLIAGESDYSEGFDFSPYDTIINEWTITNEWKEAGCPRVTR